MSVYFEGLLLGLSLIMALGPQNVFLIRQGAMRHHAFLSASICLSCDLVLITLSVIGVHQLLAQHSSLEKILVLAGSAFLLLYGIRAIISGLSPKTKERPEGKKANGRVEIILLALGFSLLNPQAIIDTFVIIGSGSSHHPEQKTAFLFGVLTSSTIWFFSLTLIAYSSANLLSRKRVWSLLELSSGYLMIYIGLRLALV